MPDAGPALSPAARATLDSLVDMLRAGRHPDGRPLGAALAARLRALAARLGRANGGARP